MVIKAGLADANMPGGDAERMQFSSAPADRHRNTSRLPADGSFGLSTDAATSGTPTDERRGATAAAAAKSRSLQLTPGLINDTRRRNSDDRASGKQEDARLKREVLKNDNNNKSTPRDPPRPLFTSSSHLRDDDDCDSYDSEFSDVASASSSFHDGEIRKKRTNSGDAKLLLRLNRVNRFLLPPSRLVNQRRQGAQEGRFSHPNKSESRFDRSWLATVSSRRTLIPIVYSNAALPLS